MTEPEKLINWTSEPPHPEKLEFAERPSLLLRGHTPDVYQEFGLNVGRELIKGLTGPGHRVPDSVDVATAALVLVNMDVEYEFEHKSFMQGVLSAMDERCAWVTERGPARSPLAF